MRRVLAKFQTKCALYTGKFESYLGRVLCKTRLIFPRLNGPIVPIIPMTGACHISRHNLKSSITNLFRFLYYVSIYYCCCCCCFVVVVVVVVVF